MTTLFPGKLDGEQPSRQLTGAVSLDKKAVVGHYRTERRFAFAELRTGGRSRGATRPKISNTDQSAKADWGCIGKFAILESGMETDAKERCSFPTQRSPFRPCRRQFRAQFLQRLLPGHHLIQLLGNFVIC